MSLEAVAERSDLTPTEVAALEQGEAGTPDIHTLIRLSTALEAAPEDLIAGIDWDPGEAGSGAFRIDREGT